MFWHSLEKAASLAVTAFNVIGGMEQSSYYKDLAQQQEKAAEQQARLIEEQAKRNQQVAERNAQALQQATKYRADRTREEGLSRQAAAQRKMLKVRRQQDIALSSARNKQAAGGGGADPTSLDLYQDIAEGYEMDAMNALYEGKSIAQLLNMDADLMEYEADEEAKMIRFNADFDKELGMYQADKTRYEGGQAAYGSRMNSRRAQLGAGVSFLKGGIDLYDRYA